MHPSTCITLALAAVAPAVFAQRSSVTSAPSMKPMPTASRAPITMEWNSKPVAAIAVSTPTSSHTSARMEAGMTMSDGSVMSMPSGMAKSGKSGMSATGTALAGMSTTGGADSVTTKEGFFRVGAMLVTLGTSVWLFV